MCHLGKRVIKLNSGESEIEYKSIYPGEAAQLDFALQLGFAFESRHNNIINIKRYNKNRGYYHRFEEILTRRLQLKNEWITATIVKGIAGEDGSIYFKGPSYVLDLMLMSSKADPQKKKAEYEYYEKRGMQCVVFAKRSVDNAVLETV